MPNKCSVPGCTSNYRFANVPNPPHVPVFTPPTSPPEHVHAWLRAIHRENISDLRLNVVELLFLLASIPSTTPDKSNSSSTK